MNIEVRQPARNAKARVGIFDCDIHPKSALEDLRPYLSNRWWDYLQTYGQRQRHGYVKGFPYPKSQPLASRRELLAARRRAAGERSRFHARAAPRSLRHRMGHHEPALADRAGRAERRAQRRHGVRRQRGPAGALEQARAAPQGVGGHSLREQRAVGHGNPQPRRRSPICPCAVLQPHQRACSASGAIGRSSRRRSRPGFRSAFTSSARAAGP